MTSRPAARRWALAPLVLLVACGAARAASVAPVAARDGMVVSAQHLATEVGAATLRAGGTAVDAAVAVGYALAVVYPAAGNLGGGGFMTIRRADGQAFFLDFREVAPAAASRDMFLDASGERRPPASDGLLQVGVPGTVAGLEAARARFGTLPRSALIDPAIALARGGFVLERGDAEMLRVASAAFRRDARTAAIFLHDGLPWEAGERLVQADLARALERVRDEGERGFYEGPTAAAIVATVKEGGGVVGADDLARYRVRERAPVECDYRGYHVITAPPPSAGGTALCEMLNILEGYPLGAAGYHAAQDVHVLIEAMRHAYADRNAYLGDPDFVDVPVARLTDKDYAAAIRSRIAGDRAGSLADMPGAVPPREGSNTTHYAVADRFGNAVSVTYTLNDWFGAKVVAAGTGILLNDEMDDFSSKRGLPNRYGLVQGEPNAIAPGKRPLSSMTPTILTRGANPVLVLGTPGGSRITTVVLQVISNMVDYGMDVQEAVDAPRLHQQGLPETTTLEPFTLSADTRRLLEAMGHRFRDVPNQNHVAAIAIGAPRLGGAPVGDARFYGANDPRRHTGLALGL